MARTYAARHHPHSPTPATETNTMNQYQSATSPALPPQILLLGLRRSGKSSLVQVFYNHLPPNDTLYLESTLRPQAIKLDVWGNCTLWDGIPIQSLLAHRGQGGSVVNGLRLKWSQVTTVIWVLDAQDDYLDSLQSLHALLVLAYAHNPAIHFHIFLHKMDGLSEDYRDDTQTDVIKRIDDDLSDASSTFTFAPGVDPYSFASDIAARQDDERIDWDLLERRADECTRQAKGPTGTTCTTTTTTTTTTPAAVDAPAQRRANTTTAANSHSHPHAPAPSRTRKHSRGAYSHGSGVGANLETDMDIVFHQTSIFDCSIFVAFSRVLQEIVLSPSMKQGLARVADDLVDISDFEKLYLLHLPTRTYLISDSSPFDKNSFEVVCDYLGFLVGISGLFTNLKPSGSGSGSGSTPALASPPTSTPTSPRLRTRTRARATSRAFALPSPDVGATPAPARQYASSNLRLDPDTVISFRQVNESLALVSMMRASSYDARAGIIEYNLSVFRRAVVGFLAAERGGRFGAEWGTHAGREGRRGEGEGQEEGDQGQGQ